MSDELKNYEQVSIYRLDAGSHSRRIHWRDGVLRASCAPAAAELRAIGRPLRLPGGHQTRCRRQLLPAALRRLPPGGEVRIVPLDSVPRFRVYLSKLALACDERRSTSECPILGALEQGGCR